MLESQKVGRVLTRATRAVAAPMAVIFNSSINLICVVPNKTWEIFMTSGIVILRIL